MASETQDLSNARKARAAWNPETPKAKEETMFSHVEDEEKATGEEFCRYIFPNGGVVNKTSIFIEECSPQRLELQVRVRRVDDVTTLYTVPVREGANTAEGFEVQQGDRVSYSIKTKEAKVRGIWIGLNLKHS